ncbi:Aspartate carbamoyltransferase [Frankliniella fusca]|uniref:Aspartate carbamoyltransferase n=1 Tax=Frankliniella fusca TaxID=407009 RepID=A0AAE1LKV5_9NEOP|nr:Aspartate carbamoyltransferase [Frankliniella fusca]
MRQVEILRARREIVNQARSVTYMSFSDIITSVRQRIPDRAKRAELTLRRLRPAMQRARGNVFPRIPQSLHHLGLILEDPSWFSLSETLDGEDNIWLGSAWGSDGSCSNVFVSSRCLQILRLADILFADGTFYITPSINGCYQVFTIVAVHTHTFGLLWYKNVPCKPCKWQGSLGSSILEIHLVIPLVWVLMERKSEAAYVAVLNLLRAHLIEWRFRLVISDFEDAIMNAFRAVFGVEVQGCFFHAAHAMAHHAKVNLGVVTLTQQPEILNIVRLCCALPLLPQQLIQRGLIVIGFLAMNLGNEAYTTVRPHLHYIQQDWLNHPNRGRSLSVCGSIHRTNNASESNNRRMKRRIGTHHPNIFSFIRHLASFEDATIDDMWSISSGAIPTRHRAGSSIRNDHFIATITRQLLAGQLNDDRILSFLIRAVSSTDGIVTDSIF